MNTQIKRKQHGSVLLTVVFVMSILIVFLFGTLALALAANNRAHVNYSSAQTSITARSVAESAVAALDKNVVGAKEYKDAVGALKSTSTPLSVKVGLSTPDTNENLGTMGHIDDVTISYAGKKKFFKDGEWLDRDLLKFTSNVTMSGVTSSASVYVLKQEKSDGPGGGSGGAGFVTTAGVSFKSQTSIWGGAYIGLPEKSVAQAIDYTDHSTFIDTFKNSAGTDTQIPACDNTDEASMKANAVYLENEKAVIETEAYICNNLYVQNWSGFVFPEASTGITVWGDMVFNGNARDGAKANCTYHGATKSDWQFNEIPYVYVDGKLSGVMKFNFSGSSTDVNVPLNVFCGQINTSEIIGDGGIPYMIGGNLYCMDENAKNIIKPTSQSPLYNFTCSVMTKTKDKGNVSNGDICCKGDLEIENVTVNGDLRVQGNLTVGNNVTVKGNVVVDGEIIGVENINLETGKDIYHSSLGTKIGEEKITIANKTGYYYVYQPEQGGDGLWKAPNGDNLNVYPFNDGNFNDYWVGDVQYTNAGDLELYYTVRQPNDEFDNVDPTNKDNIDYTKGFIINKDDLHLKEDTDNEFYVKTYISKYIDSSNYELKADYNVKVDDPTTTYELAAGPQAYLNDIGETTTYPQYAERQVLLGLEKLEDSDGNEIPTSDYKVIKTIEEVLTKVSNPYENRVTDEKSSLPKTLRELYAKFQNEKNYKKIGDFVGGEITESCPLEGELDGKLTINPNGNNLLIVMNNVSTKAGSEIIVNDTKGGNVYIIVEGTLDIPKTCLLTQSYYDLIHGTNKKIKYNSPQITDADVVDLVTAIGGMNKIKPCINIYGSAGSKIHASSGYTPISANILSPDIEVDIESGGKKLFDNFYYNNIDVYTKGDCKEMFFGSINAKNVSIPNTLNVIYVTDKNKIITSNTEDSDPFWYKILYYSEF